MAKKTPNFEKALSELETLVEDMEQGNLSLEESLKRFEKGIALSSECQQALQNAELKIKQLVEKNGKLLEQDIELDDWQVRLSHHGTPTNTNKWYLSKHLVISAQVHQLHLKYWWEMRTDASRISISSGFIPEPC